MSASVYEQLLTRVGEAHPRPRLEPTQRLVDLLGNPQDAAPMIHITGTNGKTSTARLIESMLRATGLRTGLLTSPHLETFNERIMIDGEPIQDDDLERSWSDIAPFVDLVDDELRAAGDATLTFFEVLTALAYASFADAPVDVMIIEVGMGGTWDSTNVGSGSVAVFTPIDLDHLGRIGDSLEEIAQTKAGIIKPDAVVVSAAQQPSVREVIRSASQAQHAVLRSAPDDFGVDTTTVAVGGQLIRLRGLSGQTREVFLPLFGAHQADNAALALAAVEGFLGAGSVSIADEVLEEGFTAATSPGRIEIVGVSPSVIVDGAHNPHGVRSLVRALNETFNFDELVVVAGVLGEKDVRGVLHELAALNAAVIVTQSHSNRAVPAEQLREIAAVEGIDVSVIPEPEAALAAAREWAAAADGRGVIVTGSLTLVGEVRTLARVEGWMRP